MTDLKAFSARAPERQQQQNLAIFGSTVWIETKIFYTPWPSSLLLRPTFPVSFVAYGGNWKYTEKILNAHEG